MHATKKQIIDYKENLAISSLFSLILGFFAPVFCYSFPARLFFQVLTYICILSFGLAPRVSDEDIRSVAEEQLYQSCLFFGGLLICLLSVCTEIYFALPLAIWFLLAAGKSSRQKPIEDDEEWEDEDDVPRIVNMNQ